MVHITDEGSHFDVPIEMVWKYLQSPEDHGASHPEHMNVQTKPLGEGAFQVSWDQDAGGKMVKVVNRMTMVPPVGFVVEAIEGPLAGSKFFNYYTPKGSKTGVTTVGEFKSPMIPESQLEPMVRQNFEHVFTQDTAALKQFSGKR